MDMDRKIQQDVIAELDFDPSLDASHIGVAAYDGAITLTGHVASYAEKLAAERAAFRVRGVRAVAQELEVHLPSDRKTADDEIAERVARILKWDTAVPDDKIHARVENGIVTLTGEVPWQYQRSAAERAVQRLTGIVNVFSRITVRQPVSVGDVRGRIEDALRRRAELDSARINVAESDGAVTLEGYVHDVGEINEAVRATWSAAGVSSVINHLRIV